MKKRRRKKKTLLPPEPLLFAYGRSVPGPGVDGAALVPELPPEHALFVMRAYRLLRACSRWGWLVDPVLAHESVAEWEHRELYAIYRRAHEKPDDPNLLLLASTGRIVTALRLADQTEIGDLHESCLYVSDWAIENEKDEVTVAFAEAAAAMWPDNCRPAWIAGKLFRHRGRLREAEYWFRRADRVATWTKDWEGKARALIALGNICHDQGDYPSAHRLLAKALRIARRRGLPEQEAMALHDLFIMASAIGQTRQAAQYAGRAFRKYGTGHEKLPALAYDIAYFWLAQGHFARALPVLRAALPHLDDPVERLRVIASTARAAGAVGNREEFENAWLQAWSIVHAQKSRAPVAAALVELALGACSLSEWDHAWEALRCAVEVATDWHEADVLGRAEELRETVSKRENTEMPARKSGSAPVTDADLLAKELVVSLGSQVNVG